MVPDGSNKKLGTQVTSSLPPRKINVQKFSEVRAPEIESLHAVVSSRLSRDFRSQRNKRRRTTAYDNQAAKRRYRKRQRSESLVDKANTSGSGKDEKRIPRRIKRRIEFKGNSQCGFSTSGDGTKRLRTHVWHAKRFTMSKRWDFHLPLGLHGRGKGCRAVLKRFKDGVLVHDASYCAAVQLDGPEESLISVLDMLLEPALSAHSEDVSRSILSGHTYGSAMLHHVGTLVSQPVAPITYMWRSLDILNGGDNMDEDQCGVGPDDLPKEGVGYSFRRLWVWIHASSFNEGFDVIKLACQKQTSESGVSVDCSSLEAQLAKLEVLGSKAFELLCKIFPFARRLKNPSFLSKCTVTNLQNGEHILPCGILSETIMDPRRVPKDRPVDNLDSQGTLPELEVEPPKEVSQNLWNASSGLSPPEDENVICSEKHKASMDFFCLDDPNSTVWKMSNKPQGSRSCPVMLLKHKDSKNSSNGWSIILPMNWVKVFWHALVSKGAHAIGQREKRWVACGIGLPFFPSDFPNCKAYSSFMADEAISSDQKTEKRPPASRPFRVPILPPWDCIHVSLDNLSSRAPDTEFPNQKNAVKGEVLSNENEMNRVELSGSGYHHFDGFVARTSTMLIDFLKGFSGENMLLFPKTSSENSGISNFLKDESVLSRGKESSCQVNYGNRLCLVRVILHAYKEGVFEDGAVVCAPRLSDIALWKPSLGESNDDSLKIPESSVRSYFQEQTSGKWQLHVPEDSLESHRWPIGFVTAGFVRGSKKPAAVAFCDAVLLARLRDEQWRNAAAKRRKKEIYVLVRNLRSSAYRLALASIVLEMQVEDVECL